MTYLEKCEVVLYLQKYMSKREQWLVSAWLVEETGYERWQTSKKKKSKKEETNGTAVYVGSSQTVYNPLFFVLKL